jgi:hypothetical protein
VPILEGRRSNFLPLIFGLIVLVVVALLVAELAGVIDLIDGLGS